MPDLYGGSPILQQTGFASIREGEKSHHGLAPDMTDRLSIPLPSSQKQDIMDNTASVVVLRAPAVDSVFPSAGGPFHAAFQFFSQPSW